MGKIYHSITLKKFFKIRKREKNKYKIIQMGHKLQNKFGNKVLIDITIILNESYILTCYLKDNDLSKELKINYHGKPKNAGFFEYLKIKRIFKKFIDEHPTNEKWAKGYIENNWKYLLAEVSK